MFCRNSGANCKARVSQTHLISLQLDTHLPCNTMLTRRLRTAKSRAHNPYRLHCQQCGNEFRNSSGLTQHFNAKHVRSSTFLAPAAMPHPAVHQAPSVDVGDDEEETLGDFGGEETHPFAGVRRSEHPALNGKPTRATSSCFAANLKCLPSGRPPMRHKRSLLSS